MDSASSMDSTSSLPLQDAQSQRRLCYSIFNDSGDKGGRRKFRSIDEASNFEYYMYLLQDADTTNFVLDFGDEDAWW